MKSFSGLRDNSQRAQLTITLFWAIILTSIAAMLTNMVTVAYPEAFIDTGERISKADLASIAVGLIALSQFTAIVLGTIFFLQWFRRAYYNLRQAGVHTDHSDGWAVGAWFVPFLNLVRPYTIMKEVWYGTLRMAGRSRNHVLLRWWWIAYLVHSIVANMSNRAGRQADDTVVWELFSTFFDIASAVLTLIVVRYIHQAEQEAALRRDMRQLGGPAPMLEDLHPTEEEQYA